MRRRSNRQQDELLAEINVTPFVDVLLVLLVVFMITAPLLTHSLSLELPEGNLNEPEKARPQESLLVEVDAQRTIAVEKQPLRMDQLSNYLSQLSEDQRQRPVHLLMDRSIPHEFLIQLMLVFRNSGFQQIGLVFEEKGN